jgi:hypothetical protein
VLAFDFVHDGVEHRTDLLNHARQHEGAEIDGNELSGQGGVFVLLADTLSSGEPAAAASACTQ